MGIEALDGSTVRAIGAAQVLNDPGSVVKELIDNALDARSTSISIEIHSNTLDVIQVRDNGHGIPSEDRQLVAMPHCTSKITGEDDLQNIGGRSLGFRGEALASAAEMSGSLTISTRVEGEEVATVLKINQRGEVMGQDRASLPVGTTVKITDFVKAHPVRKQAALKASEKTLNKIRQTLKAYAFARPHTRFSLRLLKAKNDKSSWTYAPQSGDSIEDAAFKIVGTACASQCTWSVIEEHGYTLQAFLPRPDADASKVSNIGAFLSVDARPVSATRGTPKQIVKVFRESLKRSNPKTDGIKDPFLFLELQCPTGSYDANAEPAKDDLLFEDQEMLIGIVRELFTATYPVQKVTSPVHDIDLPMSHQSKPAPLGRNEVDDFVTSLEPSSTRQSDAAPCVRFPTDGELPYSDFEDMLVSTTRQDKQPQRAFRPNMYGCDEEDLDVADARTSTSRTEAEFEDLHQAHRDIHVSNPWVLAKLNASVRRQPSDVGLEESALRSEPAGLPTPRPSSRPKATQIYPSTDDGPELAITTDDPRLTSRRLPPPNPTIESFSLMDVAIDKVSERTRRRAPTYNCRLTSCQLDGDTSGTLLHAIPAATPRRRQSPMKAARPCQLNTPSRSPVKDQPPRVKVWFDHLENIGHRRPLQRPHETQQDHRLVTQGELGDLIEDPRPLTPPRGNRDVREFFVPARSSADVSAFEMVETIRDRQTEQVQSEGRKQGRTESAADENEAHLTTLLSGRGFVPASEMAALEGRFGELKPDSRPAKRCKASEKRALREITGNGAIHYEDDREDEDQDIVGTPTALLRRKATDGSPSKSRRIKSSRLPLERVLKSQRTHNLTLGVSKSMREISSLVGQVDEGSSLLGWNKTSIEACDAFVSVFYVPAVKKITERLRELLALKIPHGEMVQDLGTVVEGAFAAHSEGLGERGQ